MYSQQMKSCLVIQYPINTSVPGCSISTTLEFYFYLLYVLLSVLIAGTVPVNNLFQLQCHYHYCFIQCNCKTLIMMDKLQTINNYIPTLGIWKPEERSNDQEVLWEVNFGRQGYSYSAKGWPWVHCDL